MYRTSLFKSETSWGLNNPRMRATYPTPSSKIIVSIADITLSADTAILRATGTATGSSCAYSGLSGAGKTE